MAQEFDKNFQLKSLSQTTRHAVQKNWLPKLNSREKNILSFHFREPFQFREQLILKEDQGS